MTKHERIGPPTARPLGYEQPERGAAEVYREYRIAMLKAELADLEIADPEEAERVGSELSSLAGSLEKELCGAPICSREDLLAAFDMLREFHAERALNEFSDDRDGELLSNIRTAVVHMIDRNKALGGSTE
ncbi:MAG: hypothetical protein R3C54_12890 [Parvularculaceae bacterium]